MDTMEMDMMGFKKQYDSTFRLSDVFIEKSSDFFSKASNSASRAWEILYSVGFFFCTLGGIAADEIDTRARARGLTKALHCSRDGIAIDINELIAKKSSAEYFGSCFRYSAQTDKRWLANIKGIFGNAHLEALDEMGCFSNLESVWGSIWFSRCTDLTGLKLKTVYGDIHGEGLTTANGLEHLQYVGGTIYYQDRKYVSVRDFAKEELG